MTEITWAEILPDGKIGNICVSTPEFIATMDGEWIEYFPDKPARRDGTYDSVNKRFIDKQPYPKWVLDINGKWQPPKPIPEQDTQLYEWDDPNNTWKVRGKRLIDN